MQLTTHFALEEMTASETAARAGIDNHAPADVIEKLRALCSIVLEPIREHYGPIHINSGYRCLEVNRRLASKDTSQHVRGEAADIIIAGKTPMEVCQWIAASGIPFDQLIHEFGQWTHVSCVAGGGRRQLLTIDRHGTRPGLLPIR